MLCSLFRRLSDERPLRRDIDLADRANVVEQSNNSEPKSLKNRRIGIPIAPCAISSDTLTTQRKLSGKETKSA